MLFETHTLKEHLQAHIESMFYFKNFNPEHSIERVVPTGHLFIIFELDGIPRNTFDNRTLKPNRTFTKVWLSGMHKNYLSISAHQNSEMFVIQFKPYGGYPFIHTPLNQHNDQVIPAEQIFGSDILGLRQSISRASGSSEKFECAEEWLNSRLELSKVPDNELITIVDELMRRPLLDHQSIVESYSKTQKHLITQFKRYCGLTPKVLHRVLRFNDILQKINHKEIIEWSQIAYQCGFSDQSHFIKEFKEFSGFNPQEFINLELQNKETNFFPLDEEG